MIFSDEKRMVVARRWCWRQSATSASSEATSDAVITVEAHHENGRGDIESALADLTALIGDFAGGSLDSAVLNGDNPAI